MDWLVEELRDDSLRMSTEELSTGCASGARPTYGPLFHNSKYLN